MDYIFERKAIKCETWNQMIELAKIAESLRYKPFMFSEQDFETGHDFFAVDQSDDTYVNIPECQLDESDEILLFADFIKSGCILSFDAALKEAHAYAMGCIGTAKSYSEHRNEYLTENFIISRRK